jgi:hypothetical protein
MGNVSVADSSKGCMHKKGGMKRVDEILVLIEPEYVVVDCGCGVSPSERVSVYRK